MEHFPVMLNEVIENLQIKEDGIYVDCTFGRGGHSYQILNKLSTGKLIAFDIDVKALETPNTFSIKFPQLLLIHSNFSYLKKELENIGINRVDGILFDLGVSSPQLDQAERGFSYHKDAKLDMRMNRENNMTASFVVNNLPLEELVKIFYEYGEEKFSRKIANKIVAYRQKKTIETTLELVEIIKSALPGFAKRDGHPARRVFQAIRIYVNDEINSLKVALPQALDLLNTNGRLLVISFHSLEDRIVKDTFKKVSSSPVWNKNMPLINQESDIKYRLVNKKVITANQEELNSNYRSHSAKLRIIERIKN